MSMFKLILSIIITAISTVALIMILSTNRLQAESSQLFQNSRFAILNAPVSVFSEFDAGVTQTNSVLKIDTATGQVWVLEMTISSEKDPKILSAVFMPTATKLNNSNEN